MSGVVEHRCQWLKGSEEELKGPASQGPVLYWMHRDKRVQDNWALLKAQALAKSAGVGLVVVSLVVPKFLGWNLRHFDFLVKGLKQVEADLVLKRVAMDVEISANPAASISAAVKRYNASALVLDMLPLREKVAWDEGAVEEVNVPVVRVDAHNIVPLLTASNKLEYAARTIRPKIMNRLDDFLTDFPALQTMESIVEKKAGSGSCELDSVLAELEKNHRMDTKVAPVEKYAAGPQGAKAALSDFLSKKRFGRYETRRNDPNFADGTSNLSPYFNFGYVSVQRAILEAKKFAKENNISSESVKSFVEEAVVRRELSDNFCFYNPNYDNLEGAYGWAQQTLEDHADDKREKLYSLKEFAQARTHDPLWNAAQRQLMSEGKIAGHLRMYWAKKVLEWTESPKQALDFAQRLNDRYALDGNDPNGFVGVGWSIMGIHDQGWAERAVFGKIRFMNYNGCKRKYDVKAFEQRYSGQGKNIASMFNSGAPVTATKKQKRSSTDRNTSADPAQTKKAKSAASSSNKVKKEKP